MSTIDIALRPLTMEHATLLAQYANNTQIAHRLTDAFPFPYTKEHAFDFIEQTSQHNPRCVHAIVADDAFVGCIGVYPQSDVWRYNAEMGYWLAQPFWGRGIMTMAIRQAVDYGWTAFPAIQRIFARPFGSNHGSARVLEKAGFQLEARLSKTLFKAGVYEDELIYGIRRSDAQDK